MLTVMHTHTYMHSVHWIALHTYMAHSYTLHVHISYRQYTYYIDNIHIYYIETYIVVASIHAYIREHMDSNSHQINIKLDTQVFA